MILKKDDAGESEGVVGLGRRQLGRHHSTGGEKRRCRIELGRHHHIGSRREQCSLDRRKAFESDGFTCP